MYLDADILFSLLKPGDRHQMFAKQIIESKEEIYTSVITILEVEIVAKREISDDLGMNILEAIKRKVPGLIIQSSNRNELNESLALRKKYAMGIFDSYHAASTLAHDKRIASTDHIFDRVKGLKRIKPSRI